MLQDFYETESFVQAIELVNYTDQVVFAQDNYIEVIIMHSENAQARLLECKTFNSVTQEYDIDMYRIECIYSDLHNTARYTLQCALDAYLEAMTHSFTFQAFRNALSSQDRDLLDRLHIVVRS